MGVLRFLQPGILAIQYLQFSYMCALNTYICACTSIYAFIVRWDEWYTNANPIIQKLHFLTSRKKQMACLNNFSEMAWLLYYLALRAGFGCYFVVRNFIYVLYQCLDEGQWICQVVITCFKERSYFLSGFVWC